MPLLLPNYEPPWVAVDTETSGLHPDDGARVACVSMTWLGWQSDELHTLALPFDQGVRDKLEFARVSLFEQEDPNLPEADWYEMLAWLSRQRLVFHNAKYDLMMLRAGTRHWGGIDLRDALHWDTALAQRELDPTERAGLDAATQRLGIADGKQGLDALAAWLKREKHPPKRYDLAPWDIVQEYVSTDTELTAKLYLNQMERIERWLPEDQDTIHERMDRELRLTKALLAMEWRGLLYDGVASLEAAELLEQRANEIEARLPFNQDGAHQYFFETLGLTADRVSEKTGRPSLDEEQVRKWAAEGIEWAAEYAELTKARRAVSMWYRGYPEKMGVDGRLRCVFKQGFVKSGRMSVERVQLQAMPKDDKYSAVGSRERLSVYEGIPGVRSLLRSGEGKGLWSLDLSQAELRVAAKYSGCKNMLDELLSDDPDIHGKTARNVLRVTSDDPDWKFQRDVAKRLTFGGIFMVGGKTMQETLAKLADIHMPVEECEALVQGWRNLYPEIAHTYRRAERTFSDKGYVRLLPNTPYETRSWLGPRDWPRTAWNRIVQGSLAEAFKLLMIGVEERWPGSLILTVHDSTVLEMPLDEGDQIAAEIAAWGGELMTNLFGIEMSMDTDRWD